MEIEQLQNRFTNDRGRYKSVIRMCSPVIMSALEARPDCPELEGKYYAIGSTVYPDGTLCGSGQTSLIVSGSIEEGYIETLNTVYMFVPHPNTLGE